MLHTKNKGSLLLALVTFLFWGGDCSPPTKHTYERVIQSYMVLKETTSVKLGVHPGADMPLFIVLYHWPTAGQYTASTLDTLASGFNNAIFYPGNLAKDGVSNQYYRGTPYQEEYERIANSLGDTKQIVVSHSSSGRVYGFVLATVLYSKIDSVRIVCTNQTIQEISPNNSLNSISKLRYTYYDGTSQQVLRAKLTAHELYEKTKGIQYLTTNNTHNGADFVSMRGGSIDIGVYGLEKGKRYNFQVTLYSGELVIVSNDADFTTSQ